MLESAKAIYSYAIILSGSVIIESESREVSSCFSNITRTRILLVHSYASVAYRRNRCQTQIKLYFVKRSFTLNIGFKNDNNYDEGGMIKRGNLYIITIKGVQKECFPLENEKNKISLHPSYNIIQIFLVLCI